MKPVLFYISGHGYGHAVRTAEIMRALATRQPERPILVRSAAPSWLFHNLCGNRVTAFPAETDPGMVEESPLLMDCPATRQRLADFLPRAAALQKIEAAWVRTHHVALIVADAPWLAGEIAQEAEVPCVAATNFLWDWIYEPLLENHPHRANLLAPIQAGYRLFSHWLRYPFHHNSPWPSPVTDIPLVVGRPERDPAELRQELGVAGETRPLVYLALRGGLAPATLLQATRQARDFLFLSADPLPPEAPANLRPAQLNPGLRFIDLINASDLVVGKPGYGVASACVACQKPLLHPFRADFREDQVLMAGIGAHTAVREMPLDEFAAGQWADHLRALLRTPSPTAPLALNGAEVGAEFLTRRLAEG